MKNLINCTPIEFLKQTNKIRHSVQSWLDITEYKALMSTPAELIEIKADMDEETRRKIADENKERVRAQESKNLSMLLDKALDEHAEETLNLLAAMCFVEPQDVNNHNVMEYIKEFTEMISNKDVLDFFISLTRLGQMNLI